MFICLASPHPVDWAAYFFHFLPLYLDMAFVADAITLCFMAPNHRSTLRNREIPNSSNNGRRASKQIL
eukprot:m.122870 g.122870  ORF g.122870 m.122870 type:complete len:68 (+) comp9397_c1_seq10:2885-3088(+)